MVINKTAIAFVIATIVFISLITWRCTNYYSDPRVIAAFCLLPVFLFIALRNINYKPSCSRNSLLDYSGPLLIGFLIVYLLLNWHFVSRQYIGNRTIGFYWLIVLSFFAGTFLLSNKQRIHVFFFGLSIAGMIGALYFFGEYFRVVPTFGASNTNPLSGLQGNINTLGLFIIISTLSGLFVAWRTKRIAFKWILGISIILQVVVLFVAAPRGALMLFFGAYGIVFFLFIRRTQWLKNSLNRYVAYGFFCFTGILVIVATADSTWQKFVNLLYVKPENIESISTRVTMIHAQWRVFLDHPYFGAGMGGYFSEGRQYWTGLVREFSTQFILMENSHFDLLEVLCELGIVGFVLYGSIWIGSLVLGLKEILRTKAPHSILLFIMMCVMMIQSCYCIASRQVPTACILWITIGYFWRGQFVAVWQRCKPSVRRSTIITASMLHVLIFGVFIQICIADFFYISPFNTNAPVAPRLTKALSVCPYHPYALFSLSKTFLDQQRDSLAMLVADKTDAEAPLAFPTDIVRAVAWYNLHNSDSSLFYADRQLSQFPMMDGYEIKMMALADLGHCTAFAYLRDSLKVPTIEKIDNIEKNMKNAEAMSLQEKDRSLRINYNRIQMRLAKSFIEKENNERINGSVYNSKIQINQMRRMARVECDSTRWDND